ncbi:MAG: hypothetical protein ABSB28_03865 [Candidatus Bathyarchaeia archaeon]
MSKGVVSGTMLALPLIGMLLLILTVQPVETSNYTRFKNLTTTPQGTLHGWLDYFASSVNWTESMDTKYLGYIFGETTLADLQQSIGTMTNWQDVLTWSARLHKYDGSNGYTDNQTKIQWALDNATMLTSQGLPNSTNLGSPTSDYFSVYNREWLWGYYWAINYGYDLSKWNLTLAYSNFRTAWVNHGSGFLWYYTTTSVYDAGPRYYDEEAETIACFLQFYDFNVTNALQDAQTEWNRVNQNARSGGWWNSGNETELAHYQYLNGTGVGPDRWECEAGGFLEIAAWLKYENGSTAYSTNLLTDFENRFLSSLWQSPQWNNYVVVHAYSQFGFSNPQLRLPNTLMAWTSMLGMFNLFNATYQHDITNLLQGYTASNITYSPAWNLLMFNSTLFSSDTYQFALTSPSGTTTNIATALATALMFELGLVPINATLAVPIEEMHYEYTYNMLDHDLFNINLTARNVTLSIAKNGTVAFIFNSTINWSFSQDGVYVVEFSTDWNSITSVARIGDLPSNRKYLLQAFITLSPHSSLGTTVLEGPYYTWGGTEYWIVGLRGKRPMRLVSMYC